MATSWIILVNWNGGDDTIECLESILRLDCGDFSVVIVDNGSSDASLKKLTEWSRTAETSKPVGPPWSILPDKRRWDADFVRIALSDSLPSPSARITVIEAGCNLGFAAANNVGMRFAARDPQARFFWVLNNDTVVSPDSLSVQTSRMDIDPNIGMLGARLMFYHEPSRVQGLAGAFLRWRARGYHIGLGLTADLLPPTEAMEAQMAYVLGASMFVRRELVDHIGGMSESYFLYFEELDWAQRLPRDQRLALSLESIVWHKEGGSIGSATQTRPSDTSLYYINASLLRFYRTHDPWRMPIAIGRVMREAIGYYRRGDTGGAKAVSQAAWDVLAGIRRRGSFGSPEFEAARTGG